MPETRLKAEGRAEAERPLPMISEVILENFMSYEYGRIPLRPGLNVICGPNGSGKSSILLAISVALGQVYTERSRRLSDLIRRGKDVARVTLLFDNRPKEGKRPIPFCRGDTFMLSRYIRLDGSYWFEADYREISKNEVVRLFQRMGINPDNLLIIMHQGMVEEFSIISPQEKLKMLEEAVGFKEYRERVLEAQEKLKGLLSEEKELTQILETTAQTVDYWKAVYDRYLLKRNLLDKKALLERELLWANVNKIEKSLSSMKERLEAKSKSLEDIIKRVEETKRSAEQTYSELLSRQNTLKRLYFALIRLEREEAKNEAREETIKEALGVLQKLLAIPNAVMSKDALSSLRYFSEKYGTDMEDSKRRRKDLAQELKALREELDRLEGELSRILERYVNLRVKEALLNHQRKGLEREIAELKREIKEAEGQLSKVLLEAEKTGPRFKTERAPSEVMEELKVLSSHLQTLADVPEDAEKIYSDYASSYEELKRRLEVVAENKKMALKEVEERKEVWRRVLQGLLNEVNPIYHQILSQVDATGLVRLVGTEEVESAGLELLVGFRGAPLSILDAYTQSGGERSVAVMAFLLSLQSKVVSPFRAVDEFDVHMDPRNREAIFKMIFSYAKAMPNTQHIVITPSELTVYDKDVNLIFVQNVHGKSRIGKVRKDEEA